MINELGDILCDGCAKQLTEDSTALEEFVWRSNSKVRRLRQPMDLCDRCDSEMFGDGIDMGWHFQGKYEKGEVV